MTYAEMGLLKWLLKLCGCLSGGRWGAAALAGAGSSAGHFAGGAPGADAVPPHSAESQHQRRALPAVWHRHLRRCRAGAVTDRLRGLSGRPLRDPI